VDPKPVWPMWSKEQSLAPVEIEPRPSKSQPVTMPKELILVPIVLVEVSLIFCFLSLLFFAPVASVQVHKAL
jgi:hypothetical protein